MTNLFVEKKCICEILLTSESTKATGDSELAQKVCSHKMNARNFCLLSFKFEISSIFAAENLAKLF